MDKEVINELLNQIALKGINKFPENQKEIERHFAPCMGAIRESVETRFVILTLGPSEKISRISSDLASKKTLSTKELGRLLFIGPNEFKASAIAAFPFLAFVCIISRPSR